MSTLTNQQINLTYAGLIKTNDNLAIDATPKFLEDGVGNTVPMKIGTTEIQFTDVVDFSAATVTGLAAGGLVAGSGANSMQSAAFLTITAPTALSTESISIGSGAIAGSVGAQRNIAIGYDAKSTGYGSVVVGVQCLASGSFATSVGYINTSTGQYGVTLGQSCNAGTDAIAIGSGAKANNIRSIAIGTDAAGVTTSQDSSICIGHDSGFSNGVKSVQVGNNCTAKGLSSVAIGDSARVDNGAHAGAVCIGNLTQSSAAGTVSLGRNVTAVNWIDSTTVNQLALINYAGLDFADDTAAAAGGVPLGGIYHTTGVLKIRIV